MKIQVILHLTSTESFLSLVKLHGEVVGIRD